MQLNLTFATAGQKTTFSATSLNAAIQRSFEDDFRDILIVGEVSGVRIAGSGHFYFALKDERSQVKCVLFRGAARFLKFKPQDGLMVLARGSLEVYEARGEYQLIVESLQPQGAGALQIAFERLKQRLLQEGAFEADRKRPLPTLPSKIGLVTSPSGAVLFDILHVLQRRFPGLHIQVFPAQVQGEGSIEQVCAGLEYFGASSWADVVIVARGGGSLEDLWTFNEERVARAVLACPVPVVSAIGHETDFTICDFVADVRAPTPSAAAEIIVCTQASLLERVAASRAAMLQGIRYCIAHRGRNLHLKGFERAGTLMHRAIAKRSQQCDELDERLRSRQRARLEQLRRRWTHLQDRLQSANMNLRLANAQAQFRRLDSSLQSCMEKRLWAIRKQLEAKHLHLEQISPLAVLKRGYALVQDEKGQVLRSAEATQPGAALHVRLQTGELDVAVTGTRRPR